MALAKPRCAACAGRGGTAGGPSSARRRQTPAGLAGSRRRISRGAAWPAGRKSPTELASATASAVLHLEQLAGKLRLPVEPGPGVTALRFHWQVQPSSNLKPASDRTGPDWHMAAQPLWQSVGTGTLDVGLRGP